MSWFGLGYGLFRLTADAERLPFPLAPRREGAGGGCLLTRTERVMVYGKKRNSPGGADVPSARTPKGWHSRGYLPHYDGGEIAQAVTFRLADSLPREASR